MFNVKFFRKTTNFSSNSFSLSDFSFIANWPSLSSGIINAKSYTISRVALTISSCFSLAQVQSISTISGEKYFSSSDSNFKISTDLLISSTWGFSMKMNSIIFSSIIH